MGGRMREAPMGSNDEARAGCWMLVLRASSGIVWHLARMAELVRKWKVHLVPHCPLLPPGLVAFVLCTAAQIGLAGRFAASLMSLSTPYSVGIVICPSINH